MSPFLPWDAAYAAGSGAVGGKGWNLARLARYGFPVPSGGVLAVEAWYRFADHNRLDEPTPEAVMAGAMPPDLAALLSGLAVGSLAVRSSAVAEDGATASFAGIHDSVLNVQGADSLAEAVKRCWASCFAERAVGYRRRMNIPAAPPAVVIMDMVEAMTAGVAFTLDPATGRQDRVMIAANFGLGETVVAGTAEADEFLVATGFHAPGLAVVERRLGRKQARVVPRAGGGTVRQDAAGAGSSLDDAQLLELARLALRVRWALGDDEIDQDVEWVWDGSTFFLVQARPVTTRKRRSHPGVAGQAAVWSNGNLRDGIPMVMTPMTWSLTAHNLATLLPSQAVAAGIEPMPGLTRARLIDGRCYLDLSLMQWEFWEFFGIRPGLFNELLGGHQPEIAVPTARWTGTLRRAAANTRLTVALVRHRKRADGEFSRLTAAAEAQRQADLAAATDDDLLDRLPAFADSARHSVGMQLLLMSGGSSLFLLRALLERRLPGRGAGLANALLGEVTDITSAEHGRALAELAALAKDEGVAPEEWRSLPADSRFRQGMEDFLRRWGHRGVYELEMANPRWREDQGWLLATIRAMMTVPPPPRGRGRALADQARAELRRKVPLLLPVVRWLAAQAGREAAHREEAKSLFVRFYEPARLAVLEIGRRLAERGGIARPEDAFLLTWQETAALLRGHWDDAGARALIADRAERLRRLARQPAPDLVTEHPAAPAAVAGPDLSGPVLTGLGAASGRARGRARVILHPDDGARLRPGDILVAPSTDPAWTPLFLRAAAVVMETGGLVSHGAIVAREYGLPAVVNVRGVLSRLRDGMELAVDGDCGTVTVLDAP